MTDVVGWSIDFLQEYRNTNFVDLSEVILENRRFCRWIPPDNDEYKANCDALIDQGNGLVGIGLIFRNSVGNVMAASSMFFEGVFSIKMAKLMAILKCIQFGKDCGLRLKKIESDEATVVKWIKEGNNLESDFGTVVSEIKLLIDKEEGASVCVISKGANKVAKGLAEKAFRIDENAYWMEDG